MEEDEEDEQDDQCNNEEKGNVIIIKKTKKRKKKKWRSVNHSAWNVGSAVLGSHRNKMDNAYNGVDSGNRKFLVESEPRYTGAGRKRYMYISFIFIFIFSLFIFYICTVDFLNCLHLSVI